MRNSSSGGNGRNQGHKHHQEDRKSHGERHGAARLAPGLLRTTTCSRLSFSAGPSHCFKTAVPHLVARAIYKYSEFNKHARIITLKKMRVEFKRLAYGQPSGSNQVKLERLPIA